MEYQTNITHGIGEHKTVRTKVIIEIKTKRIHLDVDRWAQIYLVCVEFPSLKRYFKEKTHTYGEALKIANKYCLELTGEEFKDEYQ